MVNPPNGNITFLFTDIEGSTKLAQNFPDSLPSSLEIHHSILKEAFENCGGFIFEIIGDAFCASFEKTIDAVNACHKAQKKLNSEKWEKAAIKVRMGIHRGYAEWNGKRYMGYITLARTHRVMSAAYGGQVLISEDAYSDLPAKEDAELSFRDLGLRRLKDLIQPVRIYQLVADGLPSDFPPLMTLDARPNNIPVQLTSFIGRKQEIEKAKEYLKNTHLLTLTGPGGAGKTRLSLQIGADVIDDFENGVWFIELASSTEPALIPQEIINELGIREETKKSLEETLISFLKDKEILIILDNCEHLIEACALLTERLLKTCQKLKIIATSREPMKCLGEQTYTLLSMEIPDQKQDISIEQLVQYESVRLFIERALTVNQNFRVNNSNAVALAGICSQLDGIPLAIELAAARTKVLTVEKIYDRLSNRFELLTGGKRTALPKQQTLKAMIDWSYDLLSDPEKTLWSRLSLFNDGWTLEAAEEICSDDKIKREDIFDLLSLLAEKSIIIFNAENERYSILETLKHYGEEKLKTSDAADFTYSKHLGYFKDLSELAEQNLSGDEANFWLNILEKEHGNMLTAIERSLKGGDREKGMNLASSLALFWDIRGYYSLGRRLMELVLSFSRYANKPLVGKALSRAGVLAKNQGDYRVALKYFEDSFILYSEISDEIGVASSLRNLGTVVYEQGDYQKARNLLEKHLEYSRRTGNKDTVANALNDLGNMVYDQGDYEQARKFHEESLTIRTLLGNKRGIAGSLNNLGNVSYNLGDFEKAHNLYEESLILKRELGDKKGITTSLHNFGILESIKGDYKNAKKYFQESLALVREIGDKHGIADTLYNLGNIEFKQEEFKQAMKFYQESLSLHREIGSKLGVVYCIMGFAAVAEVLNQNTNAACLLGFVDAALKSMSTVFTAEELHQYTHAVSSLHKKFSDDELLKYSEKGKELTLEQASELALKTIQTQ